MNPCKTCNAFHQTEGATARMNGTCRLYAPRPMTGNQGLASSSKAALWPVVAVDDGCLQWTELIIDWVDPHEGLESPKPPPPELTTIGIGGGSGSGGSRGKPIPESER